jgi:hypothetical protein
VIIIISSILFNSYEPLVNTKIAVNQLNGGDSGFSDMILYKQIKDCAVYGYILLFVLMFGSNISRVFKNFTKINKK